MSNSPAAPPSRFSLRAYQALLRLYPARYRQAYGPAMVQLFRDLMRDAEAQEGRACSVPARGYEVETKDRFAGRKTKWARVVADRVPTRGPTGEWRLARLWVRVLADTGRSAAAEHWAELRGVLGGICAHERQRVVNWRAYAGAVALVVAGLLGKALVLRATGSVAASLAVIILSCVLAALVLDRAMATRGRLLAAGLVVTFSMLLPLLWTTDAPGWLRLNPLSAYSVVLLPFVWRPSGRQAGLWLNVFVLSASNVAAGLLIGP